MNKDCCHKLVEFVVGSLPCSESFSPGSPVLPTQNLAFLNSNLIGIWRDIRLSVA